MSSPPPYFQFASDATVTLLQKIWILFLATQKSFFQHNWLLVYSTGTLYIRDETGWNQKGRETAIN